MKYINFHNETKIKKWSDQKIDNFPFIWKKIFFKEYPRFPKIELPSPEDKFAPDFSKILFQRRSKRNFSQKKFDLRFISLLLYYSAGISFLGSDPDLSRRTYPSAGARYPLELYLFVKNSKRNIKKGIYHYNVKNHTLECLPFANIGTIDKIAGGENKILIRKSGLILIISAVFERTVIKYGDRGYRYVLIEAGHLAENIYLICAALNVKCCAIAGFFDDKANAILDLDDKTEQVIYLLTIG